MKNETSLLIWDWNGTLLDDVRACFNVANTLLKKRNMRPIPDLDAYRAIFRFPVIGFYYDMGYTFETETFEAVSDDFVACYREELKSCSLMPGAEATVQKIQSAGLPQAVISATSNKRLSGEIGSFGLLGYFESVLGIGNELAASKADIGRSYVTGRAVDPGKVLFVGDTAHDAEVAQSIGCRCVLIPNGHQPAEKLKQLGVPLIGSVEELPAFIGIDA